MKNLIFLLTAILLIIGCKKYPEDDVFIQCKRPEKRLIKWSPWTFEKLYENDVDITSLYIIDTSYIKKLDFIIPEGSSTANLFGECGICGYGMPVGIYQIINKNKYLKIGFGNYMDKGNYGFIYNYVIEWEIRSLDNDDLILEATHNGKEYRIEYKN